MNNSDIRANAAVEALLAQLRNANILIANQAAALAEREQELAALKREADERGKVQSTNHHD